MKKIFLILILLLTFWNISYAEDFQDYTYIDCISWNDATAQALNHNKPYQSLKQWIEDTISYINNQAETNTWTTFRWKTFKIKVKCTLTDLNNDEILLNFNWNKYDNDLIIEWENNNSILIENKYFKIPNKTWRITFKKVKFLDNSKYWYYFKTSPTWAILWDYQNYRSNYMYYWIKIEDSYIKNTNQLWDDIKIWVRSCTYSDIYWTTCHTSNYSYSFNQILIKNTKLDLEFNSNQNFNLPFLIKDSQINIKNTWTWEIDVKFVERWNPWNPYAIWNSVLVSNEINAWWTNLEIENNNHLWLVNNKITNFNNLKLWNAVYFNNYFENNDSIDISWVKAIINSLFKSNFIDTYDTKNLRRNYTINNVENKGLWWFYKIYSDLKYFNLDFSSFWIYEEVTWNKLNDIENWIYVQYKDWRISVSK